MTRAANLLVAALWTTVLVLILGLLIAVGIIAVFGVLTTKLRAL